MFQSDRRIKRLMVALSIMDRFRGSIREHPFPWPCTDSDKPMYDPEYEVYLGFALADY